MRDLSYRDAIMKMKMEHDGKRPRTDMNITHRLGFVPFLVLLSYNLGEFYCC